MSEEVKDPLAAIEAKRAERKAATEREANAQLAQDLEAIDALEATLGDSNVAVIRVPYSKGLPAAAAVRCPKPLEMKRFRDRVRPQKDNRNREIEPDHQAAADELVALCRVYPADAETYERLCAARPGLSGQLAKEAIKLAVGAEESEGKGL